MRASTIFRPATSRSRWELSLQLALGGPLIATKGFASSEAETAYQRAQDLSRELDHDTDLFTALRGLGYVHHVRGDLRQSMRQFPRSDRSGASNRRTGAARARLIISPGSRHFISAPSRQPVIGFSKAWKRATTAAATTPKSTASTWASSAVPTSATATGISAIRIAL